MRKNCIGLLIVIASMATLGLPSVANAEGAPTIESAPTVKLGAWEDGDTGNGTRVATGGTENPGWNQYWKLKLKAGDQLIVNWIIAAPVLTSFEIYPIGTSDFTVDKKEDIAHKFLETPTRAQLRWKVSRTGVYPIDLRSQGEGVAYAFNARVKPGPPLR